MPCWRTGRADPPPSVRQRPAPAAPSTQNEPRPRLRGLVTPDVANAFAQLGLPTTLICEPITVNCPVPGTGLYIPPNVATPKPLPANTAKKSRPFNGLVRAISGVFG